MKKKKRCTFGNLATWSTLQTNRLVKNRRITTSVVSSGRMKTSGLTTVTIIGCVTCILNVTNGRMGICRCSEDGIIPRCLLFQPLIAPGFMYGCRIGGGKSRSRCYSPYRRQASLLTIEIGYPMGRSGKPTKYGRFRGRNGLSWKSCPFWSLVGTVLLKVSEGNHDLSIL